MDEVFPFSSDLQLFIQSAHSDGKGETSSIHISRVLAPIKAHDTILESYEHGLYEINVFFSI